MKIDDFVHPFLSEEQRVAIVKYFTAPIGGIQEKQQRQEAYPKAIQTIPNLAIIQGVHIPIVKGNSEEQTDVLIALHMYSDAL